MATRPNSLSLCTGLGGLDLALEAAVGAYPLAYVERDPFCAATLVARMEEKALDHAPIWDDLTTFPSGALHGLVDWVAAGFPCQPVSVAGKKLVQEDERWLWPDITRIIREVGCRYVFLENVPGLLGAGLGDVLGSLASLGFDAEWIRMGANEVGAPHRRRRIFILAWRVSDPIRDTLRVLPERGSGAPPAALERDALPRVVGEERVADAEHPGRGLCRPSHDGDGGDAPRDNPDRCDEGLGNPRGERLEGLQQARTAPWAARRAGFPPGPGDAEGWREYLQRHPGLEPAVRGGTHGIPDRVERLRALGNAVCPMQAEAALRELIYKARSSTV